MLQHQGSNGQEHIEMIVVEQDKLKTALHSNLEVSNQLLHTFSCANCTRPCPVPNCHFWGNSDEMLQNQASTGQEHIEMIVAEQHKLQTALHSNLEVSNQLLHTFSCANCTRTCPIPNCHFWGNSDEMLQHQASNGQEHIEMMVAEQH